MNIIITRHGESMYNVENRIGGDPSLSNSGKDYARNLMGFCQKRIIPKIAYVSTKRRAIQTISGLKPIFSKCIHCPELDEINAGICEDLTYTEVKEMYPIEFSLRLADKLNYRYPEGESYIDLFRRVKPFVTKIVADKEDVFIVCHRAVTRALLHHLTEIPITSIPDFDIPLHHVLYLSGIPGEMSLKIVGVRKDPLKV
jgi:broad specificity phosphatase PhoE